MKKRSKCFKDMKKLLPIIFILILSSCSKEFPLEQTVERNGITYEVNSEEPFTGTTVSYYENSQLEQRSNLKDGELDGLEERYDENGQLQSKTNFKDGERDGLDEDYHDNGQLVSKENYKDGELDGLEERYDENGQLEYKGNYKDGELQQNAVILIAIGPSGEISMDGRIIDIEQLKANVVKMIDNPQQSQSVVIDASIEANADDIIRVMDIAREAGVNLISLKAESLMAE